MNPKYKHVLARINNHLWQADMEAFERAFKEALDAGFMPDGSTVMTTLHEEAIILLQRFVKEAL